MTQDAGAGRKQELVYNASGQIIETRTIGSDGKLQQKNLFEFKPGIPVGQQTVISYWPDGVSPKIISHESYDAGTNFTSEVIELLSLKGIHTGGHRLTHDPRTGIYQCWHWESAKQAYQTVECPSGEESAIPVPLAPLTYDQAVKMQADARHAARAEQKSARVLPQSPTDPSHAAGAEIAVVLPVPLRAGERVSGSVVEDPDRYDGIPDLMVIRLTLPSTGGGQPPTLLGWQFEAPGAAPQDATAPVTFNVPANRTEFDISLRDSADSTRAVTHTVKISTAKPPSSDSRRASSAFQATPLCVEGSLCTITGPFDGDASHSFASFESTPATVLAETEDTAYITVAEAIRPGAQHLILRQGPRLIAFPVSLGTLTLYTDNTELKQGERVFGRLNFNPGDLTDAQWQAGIFPRSNLLRAQTLVPGFKLARESHQTREAREKRERAAALSKRDNAGRADFVKQEKEKSGEEEEGFLLLVFQNLTPDVAFFNGQEHTAKPAPLAFHLTDPSFSQGDFVYKFTVEALKAGRIQLKATVIPFIAPVAGHELTGH